MALGVSATHLDWTMVPYVRKSFMKHYIIAYIKDSSEFEVVDLMDMIFDNYEDDKVKLTLKDGSNRIKVVYTGESELEKAELESYLKTTFKAKSQYASALYYTIHVK